MNSKQITIKVFVLILAMFSILSFIALNSILANAETINPFNEPENSNIELNVVNDEELNGIIEGFSVDSYYFVPHFRRPYSSNHTLLYFLGLLPASIKSTGDEFVDGTWRWEDIEDAEDARTIYLKDFNKALDFGDYKYTAIFTPEIEEANETYAEIKIYVDKASPLSISTTTPTLTELHKSGATLSEWKLPAGWTWVDSTTITITKSGAYKASFDVGEHSKYNDENYEYRGIYGYDEKTHTVTRIIEVSVAPKNGALIWVLASSISFVLVGIFIGAMVLLIKDNRR